MRVIEIIIVGVTVTLIVNARVRDRVIVEWYMSVVEQTSVHEIGTQPDRFGYGKAEQNRVNENRVAQRRAYNSRARVEHGRVKSNCFVIDKKLAYISDVSKIYNKDYKYFKNLEYLILDCLWYDHHPSHFDLKTSLSVIKKFKPKRAVLTNLSPVLDYQELKKNLPKNIVPAYDGFSIKL